MNFRWFCPLLLLLFFYPMYGAGAATTTEDDFYRGDMELYPKPVPASSVKRESAITPNVLSIAYREFPEAREGSENKGVLIRITAVELVHDPTMEQSGFQSIKISSLWKNVHAKQKIDRKSLEKKADRTMGAGGMFAGRAKGDSNANQQVEKDVAYKIPEWGDHLFLLADGIAYAIDGASADLNHGADPSRGFTIPRYGQEQEVQFLFPIPAAAKNLALQFFDNANGHIQIPLSGDIRLAKGTGYPEGLIDQVQAGDLDLGVMSVVSNKAIQERDVPDGWKVLTVRLIGKSNSRKGGGANLAQIDADKYVWLEGDGGFNYNVWSLDRSKNRLSFTPEYFSMESIDFLVPENLSSFRFALRSGSKVSTLKLSENPPQSPPKPFQSFMDGDVAEWHIYSISKTENGPIVDMGVRGLDLNKGLEIKPYRQVLLNIETQQLKPDKRRSQALAFGAKDTVVVPPKGIARFLLAFNKTEGPVGLHIEGIRSKGDVLMDTAPGGDLTMITMAKPAMGKTTKSTGQKQKRSKDRSELPETKKADGSAGKEKAIVSKPMKKFTLPDWDMADAVQENELGDSIENATDLGKELAAKGSVGGKTDRYDYYSFQVDGKPQLWAIEAAGPSVVSLSYVDASLKEIIKRQRNRDTGEARMVNLLLMPGRHWIKVTGSTKNTAEYAVRAVAMGEVKKDHEREPNNDDSRANRLLVGGAMKGFLEDGDTDVFRFSLSVPEHLQFVLETSENMQGRFTVSGTVVVPEQRAKTPGDTVFYEGVFPPGDYTLRVRPVGSLSLPESYQAALLRKNPFTDQGQDDLSLIAKLAWPKKEARVAAYWPEAQRISKSFEIKNNDQIPMDYALAVWTSHSSWHAALGTHDVSLAPGEAKAVPVEILVEPDAESLEPVLVLVSAKDSQGGFQYYSFAVEAVCGAEPMNPEQYFPVASPLLGGFNAAWNGFGAEILPRDSDVNPKKSKELIDGMTPVRAGLSIPNFLKDNPLTFTVKLAGASPVPVAGVALNPLSACSSKHWARDFEVTLSSDGENYEKVLSDSLLRLPKEQYFVLSEPVPATHARLRVLTNHDEKARSRLCLGEWKVIASPEAELYREGLNIASPRLGGHVAWRSFRASDPVASQLLEGSSRHPGTAHMVSDLPNEWVIGFQHNRMARISRLEWERAKQSKATYPQLTNIRLAISQSGAAGPWEPLGEWSLNEKELVSSLALDTPVWARFIRFTADVEKSQHIELPQQIRIFEQGADASYRSIVGEWGHYSDLGPFEWQASKAASSTADVHKNHGRETAVSAEFGKAYQGTVSLGSQSAWYRYVIPEGSNRLEWILSGNPSLSVRPLLTTEKGDIIPVRSQKISGEAIRYRADVQEGQVCLMEIEEPPRSVVFAWDNSGSVSPYLSRIYQAMTSFVQQIQPGREYVNLLPFQDKRPAMLLEQWSDQPLDALKSLNAYPRKDGSSNAELNLKKAVTELEDQEGTRAVIIITDGESGKTVGNADLWEPVSRVYPRIFSIEMHSGRPASQDKMQDWAGVNSGDYSFFRNQTDLDVGFDRAVCMLRRPARFELVAHAKFTKPAGPGSIQVMTSRGSAETAIEIILDASGSMYKKLGDTTRIAVAKSVLKDLMQSSLPQGVPLALRIYGHRKANACDTRLEIPLQPFKPEDGVRIIDQVDPKDRSRTPLAESLMLAAEDLKSASGKKVVILLTDGEESCGGDPEEAIRTLREQGMDVRVNIVGLAIDSAKTSQQFSHWAKLGGGIYFEANDRDELKSALEKTLFPKFQLINKNGEVVAEGVADGSRMEVAAGIYELKVLTTPVRPMGEVTIEEGKTFKVEVKD